MVVNLCARQCCHGVDCGSGTLCHVSSSETIARGVVAGHLEGFDLREVSWDAVRFPGFKNTCDRMKKLRTDFRSGICQAARHMLRWSSMKRRGADCTC